MLFWGYSTTGNQRYIISSKVVTTPQHPVVDHFPITANPVMIYTLDISFPFPLKARVSSQSDYPTLSPHLVLSTEPITLKAA